MREMRFEFLLTVVALGCVIDPTPVATDDGAVDGAPADAARRDAGVADMAPPLTADVPTPPPDECTGCARYAECSIEICSNYRASNEERLRRDCQARCERGEEDDFLRPGVECDEIVETLARADDEYGRLCGVAVAHGADCTEVVSCLLRCRGNSTCYEFCTRDIPPEERRRAEALTACSPGRMCDRPSECEGLCEEEEIACYGPAEGPGTCSSLLECFEGCDGVGCAIRCSRSGTCRSGQVYAELSGCRLEYDCDAVDCPECADYLRACRTDAGGECRERELWPAARLTGFEIPESPREAAARECAVLGRNRGSGFSGWLSLVAGDEEGLLDPRGEIAWLALARLRDWDAYISSPDFEFELEFYEGVARDDGLYIRRASFVEGDPQQPARSRFRGAGRERTYTTNPGEFHLGQAVPLDFWISHAELRGDLDLGFPGFVSVESRLTGYVTRASIVDFVARAQRDCVQPDRPSLCDQIGAILGGPDDPPEDAVPILEQFLGGFDARLGPRGPVECDEAVPGDCNAIGLCADLRLSPVRVEGYDPAE